MQLKPIDQQVVVITGASSGIGRATALRFAERGATLVVTARSQDGLESLVNEIRTMGGTISPVVADVADWEQIKAVADEAVARYGRLDTWVGNAGVGLFAKFEETTPDEFRRIIDVNLLGQAYGVMAALPHIKRQGSGAIIVVSSIESQVAFPYHSAYASSKHGITGFVDALRVELQHDGVPISVTNIMPAAINTPFFSSARTKLGVKPAAPPPVYDPGTVADQIVYAAEHPVRDMIAGGAGKVFVQTKRISPLLMDKLHLLVSFKAQKTDEPKSVDAPDNLYAPDDHDNRIEGDWSHIAFQRSAYNWLGRHPWARRALWGTALGTAALLGARAIADD
jgi:NAD(P)-dependent dehydrogenase (short-subunit alcohol dehydrogenase family)